MTAGSPLDLVASASDFEDGDLSGAIAWSSSLDGDLGIGATVSPVLSVGDHTITASVEDSGGLVDLATVDVSVVGGSGPPEVFLVVDVLDPGEYGNKYGTDQHEVILPVLFQAVAGTSYELRVTGFDIDYNDEISVYVDDQLVGMLSKGPNNQENAGDVLALPTPAADGLVRIEFRQRRPGWKWGVTDLLVTTGSGPPPPPPPPSGDDIVLVVGTIDETEYGNKYGTDMHEIEVPVAFTGSQGTAYRIAVTGYDIDFDDEVSVHFNGTFVGNLAQGPSNQENAGDVFDLPAANSVDGTNRVVFRQRRPGWKWGVTDLLVTIGSGPPPPPPPPPGGGPPVVSLVLGLQDPNEYGNKYGSDEHLILLPVVFDGVQGASYLLEATGFDIDFNDRDIGLSERRLHRVPEQGPEQSGERWRQLRPPWRAHGHRPEPYRVPPEGSGLEVGRHRPPGLERSLSRSRSTVRRW